MTLPTTSSIMHLMASVSSPMLYGAGTVRWCSAAPSLVMPQAVAQVLQQVELAEMPGDDFQRGGTAILRVHLIFDG